MRHREQEEGAKEKTGYLLNIMDVPNFLQDITEVILGTCGSVIGVMEEVVEMTGANKE